MTARRFCAARGLDTAEHALPAYVLQYDVPPPEDPCKTPLLGILHDLTVTGDFCMQQEVGKMVGGSDWHREDRHCKGCEVLHVEKRKGQRFEVRSHARAATRLEQWLAARPLAA